MNPFIDSLDDILCGNEFGEAGEGEERFIDVEGSGENYIFPPHFEKSIVSKGVKVDLLKMISSEYEINYNRQIVYFPKYEKIFLIDSSKSFLFADTKERNIKIVQLDILPSDIYRDFFYSNLTKLNEDNLLLCNYYHYRSEMELDRFSIEKMKIESKIPFENIQDSDLIERFLRIGDDMFACTTKSEEFFVFSFATGKVIGNTFNDIGNIGKFSRIKKSKKSENKIYISNFANSYNPYSKKDPKIVRLCIFGKKEKILFNKHQELIRDFDLLKKGKEEYLCCGGDRSGKIYIYNTDFNEVILKEIETAYVFPERKKEYESTWFEHFQGCSYIKCTGNNQILFLTKSGDAIFFEDYKVSFKIYKFHPTTETRRVFVDDLDGIKSDDNCFLISTTCGRRIIISKVSYLNKRDFEGEDELDRIKFLRSNLILQKRFLLEISLRNMRLIAIKKALLL